MSMRCGNPRDCKNCNMRNCCEKRKDIILFNVSEALIKEMKRRNFHNDYIKEFIEKIGIDFLDTLKQIEYEENYKKLLSLTLEVKQKNTNEFMQYFKEELKNHLDKLGITEILIKTTNKEEKKNAKNK